MSSASENVLSLGLRVVDVTFWKLSRRSLNDDVVENCCLCVSRSTLGVDVGNGVVVVGIVVVALVVVAFVWIACRVVAGVANNFC